MGALDSLQAIPGEPILPKWQALVRWIRRQQIQSPGARITYTPNGAQVVFSPEEYSQQVRFRVTITSDSPPKGILLREVS